MERDFFDSSPERIDVVLVDRATLSRVQHNIVSCEHCDDAAEIPFDWYLDKLTGRLGSKTDYVFECPVQCLQWGGEIIQKALVEWNDEER
jgi:hypothetical protein